VPPLLVSGVVIFADVDSSAASAARRRRCRRPSLLRRLLDILRDESGALRVGDEDWT
jgi:hypothetical protein